MWIFLKEAVDLSEMEASIWSKQNITSYVVFSLWIIYIRLRVLYVTYLLSNEAVYHLKEVKEEYQSITETQNALECSYVTILKIISEGFG